MHISLLEEIFVWVTGQAQRKCMGFDPRQSYFNAFCI